VAGSKFAWQPQLQKPPAFCKKVPLPPGFPTGCPAEFPATQIWVVNWNLKILGAGFDSWTNNVTALEAPENHWSGEETKDVLIDGLLYSVHTTVDYNISSPTCIQLLLIQATGTSDFGPPWDETALGPTNYTGPIPWAFSDPMLQHQPHEGTVGATGS